MNSNRSLDPVTIPVEPERVHHYKLEGFTVFHIYPLVEDWPAGKISDAINPRSHDENVLDSPVAKAIKKTLQEDPENFVLANRGLLVLAGNNYSWRPDQKTLTIEFDGDPAVRGLADGGTTDAVMATAPGVAGKGARVHVGPLYPARDEVPWPMYSYYRPSSVFWNAFANGLLARGLTEEQVKEELQSKGTRWLFDHEEERVIRVAKGMAATYELCVTKLEEDRKPQLLTDVANDHLRALAKAILSQEKMDVTVASMMADELNTVLQAWLAG